MNLVKNIRKNTIFLLGITIIVLFFILKDDFDSIITALKSMDYLYILMIIFVIERKFTLPDSSVLN